MLPFLCVDVRNEGTLSFDVQHEVEFVFELVVAVVVLALLAAVLSILSTISMPFASVHSLAATDS